MTKPTPKKLIPIIIGAIVIIALIVLYLALRDPEVVAQNKAKRIATRYLHEKYGVTLEADSVTGGIMRGAEYSVHFKVSENRAFLAGVDLDTKNVVYESYVKTYILDQFEKAYVDELKTYWDSDAKIKFDSYIMYANDKFLMKDKSINMERAKSLEKYDLWVVTDNPDKKDMADSIYKSLVYLKHNDVMIKDFYIADSSGFAELKHYVLEDVDQYKDADEILEALEKQN